MDTLTDILNSIFVDKKAQATASSVAQSRPAPRAPLTKVSLSKISETVESAYKHKTGSQSRSYNKTYSEESSKSSDEKRVESESEERVKSKSQSESEEDERVESQSESEEDEDERVESQSESEEDERVKSQSESEERVKSQSQSESEERVESESQDESEERVESEYEKEDEILESSEVEPVKFKKYIIKSNELYKKNVLIINKEYENNLLILSDLLYKLGNTNDVFENTLNVITFSETKKHFKKMMIENPHMYFTNLNIKTTFTKAEIDQFKSNNKKSVVILDFDYIDDLDKVDKYLDKNIYLIVLSTMYSSYTSELYKRINVFEPTILINKKDRIKLLQKRLYNKIIKNIIVDSISLDDYIKTINDEDTDAKSIIVKSGEVRYN
jgi:hypothetical protein